MRAGETFFSRVFPWFFVLAGAYILGGGIVKLVHASQSKSWPTVQGRILSSKIISVKHKNGTSDKADVLYQYQVNNKTFTSGQIRFGQYDYDDSTGAKSDVEKYNRQPDLRVFYSPGNPSIAVLEPGIHGATWYRPFFGTIFLTFSCVMARAIGRRHRKDNSADDA